VHEALVSVLRGGGQGDVTSSQSISYSGRGNLQTGAGVAVTLKGTVIVRKTSGIQAFEGRRAQKRILQAPKG